MRHSRSLALSILSALLALGAAWPARAQRPLTFEDLIAFGRVSDPQVSPDGRWVAYVVDDYDKVTNGRRSFLWLASLETGENYQLTRSDKRDKAPPWAPAGDKLTFLSNRSGSWQVWTIRPDGGEATQLTDLPADLDNLVWSSDGRWLAFTAEVYPDCYDATKAEAVFDCTEKRDAEKEKRLVKARLYDRLLYRHWDEWWEGKRSHVFVMPAGGGTPRDLTPADAGVPPFLGGVREFDLSSDGKELVFARNTDVNAAWSTNSDVWIVSRDGGEPRRLTTNPAWDGSPQYSPDGRWIAYRAMARAGFEADQTRLMLYEHATGKTRILAPDFADSVGDFLWAPDSQKIYFAADVGGAASIYQLTLSDGTVKAVVEGGTNSDPRLTPDGSTLVFLRQQLHYPTEVFRAPIETGEARPLSHINDARVAELVMNPGESFTVKGAGGTPVQSWLLKPPGFDPSKKYPLVVLIHGGPQGAWGMSSTTAGTASFSPLLVTWW